MGGRALAVAVEGAGLNVLLGVVERAAGVAHEDRARDGHDGRADEHKASVVGDTVGDTRKDVVGVALDIFIKTMSTVANTLATVFQHITLIR